MENSHIHLGRQPILDRHGELVAYELLFRNSLQNQALVIDDLQATASVIQAAFTQFGLEAVLGDRLGFINISAEMLLSDMVELLPHHNIVLEILETVEITPQVIARCKQLQAMGFKLALDDIISVDQPQLALLPYASFIKIDLLGTPPEKLGEISRHFLRHRIKLLAEKVDSREQHDQCLRMGFDLFQGYYFAKPTILTGQRPSASEMTLLKLLGLVHQDVETTELETTFKHAPELTVSLLKLVNSVAFGAQSKVSTVGRALTVLGRRQLARWIQLLVFTHKTSASGAMDPLAQMAATRGKFMELLATERYPGQIELQDKAFMVGMLSLLDALFNQPLKELVESINLADDLRLALLEGQGPLGQLLAIARTFEADVVPIDIPEDSIRLQLNAMAWVSSLDATE